MINKLAIFQAKIVKYSGFGFSNVGSFFIYHNKVNIFGVWTADRKNK